MSAMRSHSRRLLISAPLAFYLLATPAYMHAQDPEQYLRNQYQGKTLVLRGFYSANRLRYNASGTPLETSAGDWTESGFVQIEDAHAHGHRLIIHAKRFAVDFIGNQFELSTQMEMQSNAKLRPVVLKVEADFSQHNPSPEQVDALMSKIFLTAHDQLSDMIPEYWEPCVSRGLVGDEKKCLFSPDILAVPGVANSGAVRTASSATSRDLSSSEQRQLFRVGNGVSPPRAIFQPEPEFTESARIAKFKGTVLLGLVVNKEGNPTNIRILNPLGSGLDAKAVQAVQSWKFEPAKKDGQPVAVEIEVDVEFHLY
jgi:TonB family protein